jgi:hypothetical protein
MTEGLVAGCGLLVLKSIKRSVINIGGDETQNFQVSGVSVQVSGFTS